VSDCNVISQGPDVPRSRSRRALLPLRPCRSDGPQPCGYVPDGYTYDLPFLFSSESLSAATNTIDRANERSAFINVLAVLMGVPPASNYYHLAAFEPHLLDSMNPNRTQGLGSGMSTYAKDCGYIMTGRGNSTLVDLMNGEVTAFSNCARNRLINNALIFASQCWGHIALKGEPDAVRVYSRLVYSYVDSDYGTKLPGNVFRQVTCYGFARAKTFLGALFEEVRVRCSVFFTCTSHYVWKADEHTHALHLFSCFLPFCGAGERALCQSRAAAAVDAGIGAADGRGRQLPKPTPHVPKQCPVVYRVADEDDEGALGHVEWGDGSGVSSSPPALPQVHGDLRSHRDASARPGAA
jgi:hypothetical protein